MTTVRTDGLSRPTISVVVPARNAAETIPRALASVVSQTMAPEEVVVVDDGSDDGTAGRVEGGSTEVTLVRLEGVGVAQARNTGAARARGDWLAFLDADDWWEPRFLAAAAEVIAAAPDAIACFGAATPVDDALRPVGRHSPGREVTLKDLLLRRVTPTTSATLVRASAFRAANGFFGGFARPAGVEDLDLWLRLALSGRCIGQPEPLAVYVVHDARDARRSHSELLALERDRDLVIDRLAARGDVPVRLLRSGRSSMRTGSAHYWLRAGFADEARRLAWTAARSRLSAETVVTLIVAALPRPLREFLRSVRRRWRR
jgi:glycosyltransferase involved in cell wall biosynthesis